MLNIWIVFLYGLNNRLDENFLKECIHFSILFKKSVHYTKNEDFH